MPPLLAAINIANDEENTNRTDNANKTQFGFTQNSLGQLEK